MVKVVTFLKRKPGMAVEAFQAYWRSRHPEVVLALPGIRRYVQSHTRLAGYRQAEPAWDGIAEVWSESTDALRAMTGSPAWARVQADEARFLDRARTGFIVTEEHVVLDGPVSPEGVKSVQFLTRKPGMAVEEFQRYWRERHGPIAARIPGLRRSVQSHTRRSAYGAGRRPAWDGVAITWFDSTAAMREAAAGPACAATRADEVHFLAPGPSPFILTREHVIAG